MSKGQALMRKAHAFPGRRRAVGRAAGSAWAIKESQP
jgi:hypothetical protein